MKKEYTWPTGTSYLSVAMLNCWPLPGSNKNTKTSLICDVHSAVPSHNG